MTVLITIIASIMTMNNKRGESTNGCNSSDTIMGNSAIVISHADTAAEATRNITTDVVFAALIST
ncbi:hypothetical protein HmCmsJML037_02587 [Escherichia coli]|nr:hypothetical protein HmCmsJML037_02587 [Escherichia coli]